MKRRLLGLLLMCVVMLQSAFPICGQQTDSISQAKEQIRLLEAIDRDPTTSPEAKNINRKILRERRLQLQALLIKAIAGLREYQSRVKSTLTSDENETVESSIRTFEKTLQELKNIMQADSSESVAGQTTAAETSSATRAVSTSVSGHDATQSERVRADDSAVPANSAPALRATDRVLTTQNTCYPGIPTIIETDVDRMAKQSVVADADVATILTSQFDSLVLLTVVDAFSNSNAVNIRQLTAYQYIGETARTDQQIGSPANTRGSTSAAEKPGWADILGFAVEHGAIQQAVSGTTLTLSTTPYAFFVPTEEDTAAAYAKHGNLRRLALSATFNISNQDDPLSNARRQSLSNYSVKFRLSPDRSPRSKEFQERWRTEIKPTIQRDLALIGGNIKVILKQPGVRQHVDDILDGAGGSKGLIDEVSAIAASSKPAAQRQTEIKNAILCALDNKVFQETKEDNTGLIKIDSGTRRQLVDEFVPALFEAQGERVRASEAVQKIFDDLDKKWRGTLTYTNNRAVTGSDYSEVKFLFQNYFGNSPIKLVANAGFSLYHKPDPLLHQQNFRNFAAAFSFEGQRKSPFITDPLDQSQITFSLTGRYERLQENRGLLNRTPDIGVVQFKLEIPIGQGMSIPFSLTYANATEQQKEQHVRGNFGFTFNFDKFLILRRLLQR